MTHEFPRPLTSTVQICADGGTSCSARGRRYLVTARHHCPGRDGRESYVLGPGTGAEAGRVSGLMGVGVGAVSGRQELLFGTSGGAVAQPIVTSPVLVSVARYRCAVAREMPRAVATSPDDIGLADARSACSTNSLVGEETAAACGAPRARALHHLSLTAARTDRGGEHT
jgi:hypothetical protein